MPADTPVINPEPAPMVALAGLLLVHDSPGAVGQVAILVLPTHTPMLPSMAAGNGFTVTPATLKQPFFVYVIMGVPGARPITTPVALTVPKVTLLLAHVPPVVVLLSVVVAFWQTFNVPVIAAGNAITVTVLNTVHPEPRVYVILAVPATFPVTTPVEEFTLATVLLPLIQVPPLMPFESVVVALMHTVNVPVTAGKVAFTVTTTERAQPSGWV